MDVPPHPYYHPTRDLPSEASTYIYQRKTNSFSEAYLGKKKVHSETLLGTDFGDSSNSGFGKKWETKYPPCLNSQPVERDQGKEFV